MEFMVVAAAVVMSVLLALGSTRVVLWMLMLGIVRDALPQPAVAVRASSTNSSIAQ
jgi:hypothetical protein